MYEHYEEHQPSFDDASLSKTGAALRLAEKHPGVHPGTGRSDRTGVWLGPIDVYGLQGEMHKREQMLTTALSQVLQEFGIELRD